MRRLLIQNLIEWKSKSNRKPLILQGVRQTGKTYLLEEFGKTEFPRYHIINFEKFENARKIFDKDLEPERIIDDLQFFLNTKINTATDLVIFDEIQACPRALTSLKYFCEDMPELALASAGSLLGLKLNDSSYPVGKVDMLHLYPMTFMEFLMGIGDEQAVEAISKLKIGSELTEIVHKGLWERFKHYLITGGLPEVISTFASYDDFYSATNAVRAKQEELIKGYYADIAKHAGKINSMHIDRVWRSIPQQLSQAQDGNIGRFRFKGIIPSINRYSQLVNVIDWLDAAELVIKVPIVTSVKQPLYSYTSENRFKLFMFDVGILGAMSGLDPKTILDYNYGSYKGYFAENFVVEQLLIYVKSIYRWQSGRSEIEFLFQHDGKIIPVEVKAGEKTRARSLQKYINKYSPNKSFVMSGRNIISQLNDNNSNTLYHVPLYLIDMLSEFL